MNKLESNYVANLEEENKKLKKLLIAIEEHGEYRSMCSCVRCVGISEAIDAILLSE